MTFRPLSPRSVRWRAVEGEGLGHCAIAPAASGGIHVRSLLVVGGSGGAPDGVSYEIDCDAGWRVLALRLEVVGGPSLHLVSDGRGRWRDAAGAERADLAGCIDIDLAGTPFTNTLPIRRMDLMGTRGPTEFRMLYVPFDTFEPFADDQRYTILDPAPSGDALPAETRVRYEAVDRSFSADLRVDEDGLVTDYPMLFERI